MGLNLWCVAKSATVREQPEAGSRSVGTIPFGKYVICNQSEPVNGRIMVTYNPGKRQKRQITGWVPVKAFSHERIIDFAKLYFVNNTGKRIPIANKYKGIAESYIDPNERVSVIAKVGDWCLTNKGWTMFSWLTKDRNIFDDAGIADVLYGVLTWAAKDYKGIIRHLKRRQYHNQQDYCEAMEDLNCVIRWFLSEEYALMYDAVPGNERLQDMNEEMGVTDAWLAEQRRIHREITLNRLARGKKKGVSL